MTNKEKYPNTDDAIKAFKKHNECCDCGCTFEEWLKKDAVPSNLGKSIAGVMLGSLLLGGLVDGVRRAAEDEANGKSKPDKPSDGDELTGIECPVCHGKNGEIDDSGFMGVSFVCKDCGIFMDRSTRVTGKDLKSVSDAKLFLADLCKKNRKKD